MKPKLSLIICSRDRATQLKKCLTSISAKEMQDVNGELIFVNNGSTDNTEEVMRSFKESVPFPVKIVKEPTPGKGNALNAGILKAEGEALCFIDDDCYLTPEYLIKASKIFESGDFHYCGGRILLYDETDAMCSVNYLDKQIIIPPNSIIYPGKIQGHNMAIHRKVVDKIGLFDPMFGAGTQFPVEDADYVTRASLAGFTGAYLPELVVYHHHGRKPGVEIENLLKCYAYARGAFFIKFILMGKVTALICWIPLFRYSKNSVQTNLHLHIKTRLFLFIKEIYGGMHYLFVRVKEALT